MTEIIDRPRILGLAMGRSAESQRAYEAYTRNKLEQGETSCDLCRVAQENKLGVGVLEIVSKEREIEVFERALIKVENELSFVENEFGYDLQDGQLVDKHFMILPLEHYARMSDLPKRTKKAYDFFIPKVMDVMDATFTRSPDSRTSSQKGHLHTHAVLYGDRVDELHYTQDQGTIIRRRGSAVLELL